MKADLITCVLFTALLFDVCTHSQAKESKALNFTGNLSSYFNYHGQPSSVGGGFSMALFHPGQSLSGEIIELVTLKDKPAVAKSSITGIYKNKVFNFIKSYDGSGGRDHSVNYEVKYEKDLLFDQWTAGEFSGPIVLSPIPIPEYAEFLKQQCPQ